MAGGTAKWVDLDWAFPILERMVLEVAVSSNVLHTSTQIGTTSVSAPQLIGLPLSRHGERILRAHILNGAKITGTINIRMDITPERISSLEFFFSQYLNYSAIDSRVDLAASALSGYGSVVFSVSAGDRKLYEPKPNHQLYLPSSSVREIPDSIPFRMNITSITVSDLKSVHLLKANSPSVNAGCGQWGASTKVKNTRGTMYTLRIILISLKRLINA